MQANPVIEVKLYGINFIFQTEQRLSNFMSFLCISGLIFSNEKSNKVFLQRLIIDLTSIPLA